MHRWMLFQKASLHFLSNQNGHINSTAWNSLGVRWSCVLAPWIKILSLINPAYCVIMFWTLGWDPTTTNSTTSPFQKVKHLRLCFCSGCAWMSCAKLWKTSSVWLGKSRTLHAKQDYEILRHDGGWSHVLTTLRNCMLKSPSSSKPPHPAS